MGLDMYAYSVDNDELKTENESDVPLNGYKSKVKIYYWRKFNALHHWMEQLYRKKGGEEEFNCTTVRLLPYDIEQLEIALKKTKANEEGALTPTEGFFFGSLDIYPEDLEDLEIFIQIAKDCFTENKAIFYDSWW